MRFLLAVLLFIPWVASANCANEVWNAKASARIREMQPWVLKFFRLDDGESYDLEARMLEIAQEIKAAAIARIPDLPSELREIAEHNFDGVEIESAPFLSNQNALNLSSSLSHMGLLLRKHEKAGFGGMPGAFVSIVNMSTPEMRSMVQVGHIDESTDIGLKLLIEPRDETAFDLVLDTGSELGPATHILRSLFVPRYRHRIEAARTVSSRLASAMPSLPSPRLAELNAHLIDLWDKYDAGDTSVFREIGDSLEELHMYFVIAVHMNRSGDIPDAVE